MSIVLTATWKYRELTLQGYFRALRDYLGLIHQAYPMLAKDGFYYETGPSSRIHINPMLWHLNDLVKKKGFNDRERPKKTYKLDDDGTPAWDSTSRFGYHLMLTNGTKRGEGEFQISAGDGAFSPALNNVATLAFRDDFYPEARACALWRNLMPIVVHCWRPEYILVSDGDYKFSRKVKETPPDDFEVSWINYFANAKILELKDAIEGGEVTLRPFGPGALLELAPSPPSPDDDAAVARAIRIRDLLRQHGLLKYRDPPAELLRKASASSSP